MSTKVVYRLAVIGDDPKLLAEGQKFVEDYNEKNKGSNFQYELLQLKDPNETEINAQTIHSVLCMNEEVRETTNEEILKRLLISKDEKDDLNVYPLVRDTVTKNEVIEEQKYLEELSGKKIDAPLYNVSNDEDLRDVFQGINVVSAEYKAMAEDVVNEQDRLLIEYEETAKALLEAIEAKDPYTASHFKQVAVLSRMITIEELRQEAKAKNMTPEQIEQYIAENDHEIRTTTLIALLHDAGKLNVPKELLNTPHLTTASERGQVGLHELLGEKILAQNLFTQEQLGGINEHHRRGSENKYANRIAVADCLDTMTSQRAYNNPKAIQEVFRDLAQNKNEKRYTDDKGVEHVLKPQFAKKDAIAAIIMLAKQLGDIGYDAKAMIEATTNEKSAKLDEEILEILNENKDDIIINAETEPGRYCELGFRLDEVGCLEFADREAAPGVNRQTRVNFEYESLVERNSSKEVKDSARNIEDLEAYTTYEKLEEYKSKAEENVNRQEEAGRKAVQAGRVHRKSQVLEAAKNDKTYTKEGYIVMFDVIKMAIGKSLVQQNIQNNEQKNEGR